MSEQEQTTAQLAAEFVSVMRRAIEFGVMDCPKTGINILVEYFEEAGVDDPEMRKVLDAWWDKERRDGK